jgi:hypothetical protein
MWWLYSRRSRKFVGVVIIEAPTEDVALVSPNCIGRLLWAKEAQQLSDRLCAAKANGPRVANYREENEVEVEHGNLIPRDCVGSLLPPEEMQNLSLPCGSGWG